ncbi:tRNA (adenosine(37)-N6)-threonylcarbamoyltransferase complex ATPase subunit type 1 TsaE [Geobacter sp. DSM 9736]|uniref:tRNA (adenosine(37)-N6)-threonylcarbamoyltransferase complex ATPase subunit type 1 TsaE n=1 Tax=Geobacter sp. DSM 9736 TaxID=1277350 RepID=UPI000B50E7AE|nr:tRNA (adenosine(37)-N6)-threonylcarbamoyltransferase complex ATPase subunit type 1 TsaE [Geobacter sp. DSM 9736]SNB45154.1 tRNA threonylcarbamoyladenosine biosynthesis protein TsaE [Geobacter sp. DSM 9736]
MTSWTVTSRSCSETVLLGERLGMLVEPGDFVALIGDLGAGKTEFAKGVAAGLGVDPSVAVTSPTYILMNIYEGRLKLYHFDLYRLSGDEDSEALGFHEYFEGEGACLVEWADRLDEELPVERLAVQIIYEGEKTRTLNFSATGARYEGLLAALAAQEL